MDPSVAIGRSVGADLATVACAARRNRRESGGTFEVIEDPSELRHPVEAPAITELDANG